MTNRSIVTIGGCLAIACSALAATDTRAGTWTELLDAGDQVATAQYTLGAGALTLIEGALPVGTDVDMFCIRIPDPQLFAATIGCANALGNDLWLFDAVGFGVVHDDGCSDGLVALSGAFVAEPGIYYLAISGNNSEARSGVYPIWEPASSNGERAPDGVGSFAALNLWAGESRTAATPYEILLSGCSFCEESIQNLGSTWGRVRALYR